MRLIDADEVLARIENPYQRAEIARWLMAAPTIERKTGIWRRAEYGYTCNQCGKTHTTRTAYCPTCGAEMDC